MRKIFHRIRGILCINKKGGHKALHYIYIIIYSKQCHSEPVRTLAWESPVASSVYKKNSPDLPVEAVMLA